jgi:hypothetical protein
MLFLSGLPSRSMKKQDALRVLSEAELVTPLEGGLREVKELVEICLAAEIPALPGPTKACGSNGCAPKVPLLVRKEDAPKVAELLRNRWVEMLRREGTMADGEPNAESEEGEPPCPACGTAALLVDGACSDCGLKLE